MKAGVVAALQPSSVLDAGGGLGESASELRSRGITVEVVAAGAMETMQLAQRFDVVVLAEDLLRDGVDPLGIVHIAAVHLRPGGQIVAELAPAAVAAYQAVCALCELASVDRVETGTRVVCVNQRSERFNIHDLVHEARESITRLTPIELQAALASADPPLVVDTRTDDRRAETGMIPGSIHVPRLALEWHLDPANGYRHPDAPAFDRQVVVVCNHGYSSSLAAANLRRTGFHRAGDVIGGFDAWLAAALPVVR